MVPHTFNPRTKRNKKVDFWKFEIILVYTVSSRTTRIVAQRKSVQKYTYTFFFL